MHSSLDSKGGAKVAGNIGDTIPFHLLHHDIQSFCECPYHFFLEVLNGLKGVFQPLVNKVLVHEMAWIGHHCSELWERQKRLVCVIPLYNVVDALTLSHCQFFRMGTASLDTHKSIFALLYHNYN
jgi:hypothetical protein